MNVIVSNKQKAVIDNANIDAIKDLNGLFNIDDLINKFRNYFFSKMILDATSIVNFANNDVLEKLASGIGSERLIILLPSSPEPPKSFIDKLNSLGIYNYSTNINDVVNFISKPRLDVENKVDISQNIDNFYVDTSVKSSDDEQKEPAMEEKTSLEDDNNYDIYDSNDFNENNSTLNSDSSTSDMSYVGVNKRIIGIKNVTLHAGSTSLIYMLTKTLKNNYNKRVLAIEVNKDDFKFYQDSTMISVSEMDLNSKIINSNAEIIFIDLNNCTNLSICDDVLYLVEPSIIRLNRLMIENPLTFRQLRDKKIVLNQSFLSNREVDALSNEAGVKMFYNIPSLNDRIDNNILIKLMEELQII